MNDFEEYFSTWVDGLESEISWWNDYMRTEGLEFFYSFRSTILPNKRFELEDEIPEEKYGQSFSFLDVGSGPFSRCGNMTDKVDLSFTAIDPLADAYNVLKDKYDLNNGVVPKTGFAELLEFEYEPNSFDMVHMSNSLDHSFSAIDGLYQLLNVCKVGGCVVLRHHENEAENEGYIGLHQWNLSLKNKENSFVIWRKDERYDVCKIFGDYADFIMIPDIIEDGGHWIYNKVIMKKKKNITMPDNRYFHTMFGRIYSSFINLKTRCVIEKKTEDYSHGIYRKIDLIKKMFYQKEKLINDLKKACIQNIGIYGMGDVGKNIGYLLYECGYKDVVKFDIKGRACGCADAVKIEDYHRSNLDLIIVSINDFEAVKPLIVEKFPNCTITTVDELLGRIHD